MAILLAPCLVGLSAAVILYFRALQGNAVALLLTQAWQ